MTLKRECQNCCHFQDAEFARGGWCRHPSRNTSPGTLILVRGSELACRDDWGSSLWESLFAQVDDSLVRIVQDSTFGRQSDTVDSPKALADRRSTRQEHGPFTNTPRWTPTVMPRVDASSVHRLRVFICHASDDKPLVRTLYKRLVVNGIKPWFDEEELLPGQDWQLEISKAVRRSDVVIICLTSASVNKTGFVQKEIRFALDVAQEQPEGSIFLVPLRLEECSVPESLRRYHWANLYAHDGFDRLMRSLLTRAMALGYGDHSKTSVPLNENAPMNLQPPIADMY